MKKIILFIIMILIIIPSKCFAFENSYMNSQFTSTGTAYIGKSLGDPFIIYDNGYYYVYGTGLFNGKKTKNFNTWEKTNDKTSYDFVNREKFWAPEVFKYGDYYYKVFSSFEKGTDVATIGIASSKSLNSSFTIKTYDILGNKFSNSVIDADILIDGDNQYLYFAEDQINKNGTPISSIYGVQIKLSNGDCSVIGNVKLLKEPDTDSEKKSYSSTGRLWNEGPSVIKNNSKYYLMYSSNYWASSDYNVSYVVSDSPLGQFKRPEGSNVLLNSTENSIGPGHNSVFKSPTGELYTVYHIKDITSTKSTWERSLAFDRLGFIGDKLFVNGPTYSSVQSLPSGINNYNIVKPSYNNTPSLFNIINNFSNIGGSYSVQKDYKINAVFNESKRIKNINIYPGKNVKESVEYNVNIWINNVDVGNKKIVLKPNQICSISLIGNYNVNNISLSFSNNISLSEISFLADNEKNISINTKPAKLIYIKDIDNLDVSKGKININYYNTSTSKVIDITPNMVSGFDNKKIGKQTLTITYGKFKTTYDVEVIEITCNEKYKINNEKGYIYTGLDTDSNTILSNLKINGGEGTLEIKDNKVLIKNNNEVIREYKLLNITKTNYDLSREYIYTKITDFDILKITTNCELTNVNNTLEIGYNGEVFNTYKIVNIKSDYKIYGKWIYIVGEFDINKIIPTNATLTDNKGILEVKYNNEVIDSLTELKIDFGSLKVNKDKIVLGEIKEYTEFMKNIKSDNLEVKLYKGTTLITKGNIEEGMTLKVISSEYGEIMPYTITKEYVDVSKLEIDKKNYIKKYNVGTTYEEIRKEIDTSGSVKFIDNTGKELENSDIIRTGSKVVIELSTGTKEYTIVVYGDINGDGKITMSDLVKSANYLIDETIISEDCYKEAIDVTKDGNVRMSDIIKLSNILIGGNQ